MDLILRVRTSDLEPALRSEISGVLHRINAGRTTHQEHLEWDFYEYLDVTMNGLSTLDRDRIWADARRIPLGKHRVAVMSPEDLLLTAAINALAESVS